MVKESLRKIKLLENLTASELSKIERVSKRLAIPKGEEIITEGSHADSLYLIQSGLVKVVKKDEYTLSEETIVILESGDSFGEMAIIDKDVRSATVIALEDSALIEIDKKSLEDLFDKNTNIALKLYRSFVHLLCDRLKETNKRLSLRRRISKAGKQGFKGNSNRGKR